MCVHRTKCCLASVQLAPQSRPLKQSLSDYELDNQDQQERQEKKLPQFSCQSALLLRRGDANHKDMSGKADHFAGFPKSHISRKYTQEDSTAGKMDKVKQVSVAANFSRRCSRVGKIQAFEDGLTLQGKN